jgi:hypothetical protein
LRCWDKGEANRGQDPGAGEQIRKRQHNINYNMLGHSEALDNILCCKKFAKMRTAFFVLVLASMFSLSPSSYSPSSFLRPF